MSKEDISMLQKTGHFYLVLTVGILLIGSCLNTGAGV